MACNDKVLIVTDSSRVEIDLSSEGVPSRSIPRQWRDLNVGGPCCPPISEQRLPAQTAAVLAPAFKALGDPVRLQLMSMIASAPGGEICVCDLTPAFTLSGPTISHHLRTLREAGLVDAQRRGTWVYYRAQPGLMRQLAGLLTAPPAASAA